MKSWIMALGALAVVSSGCGPVVLEPLQGGQPLDSPESPAALVPNLLVGRGGDLVWNDNFVFATGKGAPWTDPDSLVLFFSNDLQKCSDPVLPLQCTGTEARWQLVIVIPPELDRPGLIDLADTRINQYSSISHPDGTLSCGGGGSGGALMSGTLELISSGSTSLSVKLLDGVKAFGAGVVDGDYTAQICGALPPAPPPTPAIAFRGADLPPAPGSTVTTDPDALVVFLGTLPTTCQDPWSAVDCSGSNSRLSFTLPLALQTPGEIDLADPVIAATYTVGDHNSSTTCHPPSGPFDRGILRILSSDAGGLTFQVYQSAKPWAALTYQFDGLYSASICP